MPVLVHRNTTTNPLSTPFKSSSDLGEPKLQSILFSTVTLLLAAASLGVAYLHFRHQKNIRGSDEESGQRNASRTQVETPSAPTLNHVTENDPVPVNDGGHLEDVFHIGLEQLDASEDAQRIKVGDLGRSLVCDRERAIPGTHVDGSEEHQASDITLKSGTNRAGC
ncbi:hypothetical protein K469DRAFT_689028 [Zopfia rhizophila CBS 207.26]|uniref:Uncharacterized protein n=1 Tax=Zopfia rhizophila CBS 207.26 TaxID=1314779 RepID=A0A6A6EP35_9PEZI|nr:hypothetical protein K469DRAFT_689028 [Zopfia rhizophila CBS 207.26]